MRIVTVLKSGGEFKPSHVQALQRQCTEYAPGVEFVCLTDIDVRGVDCVPLICRWPGWYSKLELFAPDIQGDLLYMDLDTVIAGSLGEIIDVGRDVVLRDFYKPDEVQSSLMYLTPGHRAAVYTAWCKNPAQHMADLVQRGDQGFLERFYIGAPRWQDILPGQVLSWKVGGRKVTPDARIVILHGKPRPWAVQEFKHLYE